MDVPAERSTRTAGPNLHPAARPAAGSRRRRPTGEPPPLPHHLQTSGVRWLVATLVLIVLAVVVFAPAAADVRAQLDDLIYPGWVTATGRRRLPDVLRYVRAMQLRLDRLPGDLAADADRMESLARVTDAWRRAAGRPPATRPDPAALAEIRWMLEELRVSYFAQSLGTAHPVSEKRVLRAIDRLGG